MSENENWVERRQRMVKCKVHGLHYDPKLSSGCARCVKQAERRVAPRPPQLTIILLCLLGIVAIGYQIFGPQADDSAAEIGAADTSTAREEAPAVAVAAKLDPEPYRPQIEALETVLFARPIEKPDDLATAQTDVVVAFENLEAMIRSLASQPGASAADAIDRLRGALATSPAMTFQDFENVRRDWLRTRERYLRPAVWFVTPIGLGAPDDQALIVRYREAANTLVALMQEGAARVEELSEAEDGVPAAGRAEWEDFAQQWSGRLEELRRGVPAQRPSTGSEAEVLLAIQSLERAIDGARRLAADPALRRGGDLAGRFSDVLAAAEEARRAFERAV